MVISIIAILAGMLLPAIGMVRRSAQATRCAGNLRQIGLAFHTYADDHEGIFPPLGMNAYGATTNDYTWYPNLLDASGLLPLNAKDWQDQRTGSAKQGVWRCPTVTDGTFGWGGGYGVLEDGTHGFSYTTSLGSVLRSQWSLPASRVLLADAERKDFYGGVWKSSISMRCSTHTGYSWDTDHRAAARHGGSRTTTVFADGHAAAVPWNDLRAATDDPWRHTTR